MLRSTRGKIQAAKLMKLTRRQFGGFAAALPIGNALAGPLVRDPEVVVVGAGAAGIAAAQTLINGGRRVQVIEAGARVGGRCFTDFATLGLPFDRGATWLRNADRNPVAAMAKLHAFEIGARDAPELLFARGAFQPRSANAAYERAFIALSDALANIAEQADEDAAAGDVKPFVLDDEARAWGATAAAVVGPLDMGVDLKQMSVKDWFQREEDEPSRMVRQGVGSVITRLAHGLPIAVNAPATRISVVRGGVRVETPRGMLSARAAIVTPSVGVLASGAITFDPPLDPSLQSALGGLQMGLLTKIAMRFQPSSPALAFANDSVVIPQVNDERGHFFLIKPFGAPLIVCFVGGSLAWDLATQNEATNIAFARDRLRAIVGAKAEQGFRGASATDWGSNPLTRGAFAAALPGQWRARKALETPIGERVFLAGEAQSIKAAQTVHGACESGQRAARRVLKVLKG